MSRVDTSTPPPLAHSEDLSTCKSLGPTTAFATSIAHMPMDADEAMDSSGLGSPKRRRIATKMSLPCTGEQTRAAAELAPDEREQCQRRILDLEAALQDTEQRLQAAQLETQRIQLGENFDDALSLSSEGSQPDSGPEINGMAAAGADCPTLAPIAALAAAPSLHPLMVAQRQKAEEIRQAIQATAAAQTAKAQRRQAVADLHLPAEQQPSDSTRDWNLKKFQDVEKSTQEKRKQRISAEAASASAAPKLRKGRHGWQHNSRQGLVGAVQYWAAGSRRNVVSMLLGLINHFGVTDEIRQALFRKARRHAETDTYIVDRLKAALDILKGCQTEQQRRDFHLALALVAPTRVASGDHEGMARRVSARLRVQRGMRSKTRGERPYAFEAATLIRANFDLQAARFHVAAGPLRQGQQHALVGDSLQPGERVLTQNNGEAELARFTGTGGCVLVFRAGDNFKEVEFKGCYGKGKGSAGLRRIPPSLSAPPRKVSSAAISDAARLAILDHVRSIAPTSPHTRDVMRRRVGPFLVEEKPAFIQSDPIEVHPIPNPNLEMGSDSLESDP